jgi:hypothetical protein
MPRLSQPVLTAMRADAAAELAAGDARVAPLLDDLRRRLRPACRDWSEAEFEAVIQRIARAKLRWTDSGYWSWNSEP